MGWVVETQVVAYLFGTFGGENNHTFGFEYEAVLDVVFGSHTQRGFDDFIQVVGRDKQSRGIVFYLVPFREMFFDEYLEFLYEVFADFYGLCVTGGLQGAKAIAFD